MNHDGLFKELLSTFFFEFLELFFPSLRMLATLGLERQKSHLISGFVDNYLQLDAKDMRIFKHSLEKLSQDERREIMQFTTSWKEEGRHEGRVEGLLEGLETALQLKFGEQAGPLVQRMQNYSLPALKELRAKLLAGAPLEQL